MALAGPTSLAPDLLAQGQSKARPDSPDRPTVARPFEKCLAWPFHEFHPDYGDAELAACVRMGFNQILICSDSWGPGTPQLHQFCESEIFPGLGDPKVVAFAGRWIQEQTERCQRHGLESFLYVIEPLVPFEQFSVYAPQSVRDEARPLIPTDCLGVRKYGSVTGHPLCISHPTVQAYYRTRTRELFRRFPLLKGLVVLTGDGRNEFCDDHCPRCAARFVTRDELSRQLESYALLLNQLHAGAEEARPGIEIFIENHNLNERTFDLAEQLRWPLGIMAKFSGEECYAAHLEPAPSFRSIYSQLSRRGNLVYAYHEFLAGEEYGLAGAFPDPFAVIRQVRALQAEGVKNLATFWGMSLSAETVKAQALRKLLGGSTASEEQLVRDVCADCFGDTAAEAWVLAFRRVSAATQIWMTRLGYHNFRQGFYGARFRIFTWPGDFPLTYPEGVPKGDWEWWWRICFDGSEYHRLLREANLVQMPRLLAYLDSALDAMRAAQESISFGTRPKDILFSPNQGRDSRWFGEQAIAQVALARELAESELNMYRLAKLRDEARDGKLTLPEGRTRLLAILQAEESCMRRVQAPLKTVLSHHRPAQLPKSLAVRTRGNVEKTPERWEFLSRVEQKLQDLPQARQRAVRWLEKTLA
jgi:hypothetical protein